MKIEIFTLLVTLLGMAACGEERTAVPTTTPTKAGADMLLVREMQVPTDDVTLHARVAGDLVSGRVLIAVHGGPGMSSDYMLSLEGLAGADFAVVTYDQRGTGRSSAPPADPSN